MPWTLIDSATESDSVLELYGKDGMFMIRANGFELMNGFHHESETALGMMAASLARSRAPRVLVGGLGLGYTVAALTEALAGAGTVTVAELSATVIDWFERHIRSSVLAGDHDNLVITHADVVDLMTDADSYDVVVLDTDNGPEPLVTARNARIYSVAGLRALHACLAPRGTALLWSGFESAAFEEAARHAGFAVRCDAFQRARADLSHYVYVLTKNSAIGA